METAAQRRQAYCKRPTDVAWPVHVDFSSPAGGLEDRARSHLGGERAAASGNDTGDKEKAMSGLAINLVTEFDHFKICFQEGQGILTFEPAKTGT
jgi:hypothetical protein